MDDILVYSNTNNDYIKYVKIKTEKCRFHVQK